MPDTKTIPIAPKGSQGGIGMWPSESLAASIYDAANIALICALVLGVVATSLVIWMGNVKEQYSNERALKLENDNLILQTNLEKERIARLQLEGKTEGFRLEIAKANQAAAEARLEQERLKKQMAWRGISPEQQEILVSVLKGHPMEVWTAFVGTDLECVNFHIDINKALTMAGIKTNSFSGLSLAGGLSITDAPRPESDLLAMAFKKAGLPFVRIPKVGGFLEDFNGPIIVVGSKHPPLN